MELWDAYDENFNRIEGAVLERGKPIPAGMFHLVADILVRHTDGSYLLMKRDPHKMFGGMWQASAGGSALRGESPLACAKRELFEETGIAAHTMSEIGRDRAENRLYAEFLCVTDHDKQNIALQAGETVDHLWVSRKELLSFKERGLLCTVRIFKFLDELNN